MSMNFGQVVNCNNILALKDFTTFLFNYQLHEKPNFIEKWLIKSAELWIELRARKEFIELRQTNLQDINLSLNDCKTGLFTVLHLAIQKEVTYGSGKELFQAISNAELEFEKIKKPREEMGYAKHEAEFGTDPK